MSIVLKKKYGQNFLIDNNVLNKISNLITKEKCKILEIGPGDGRLTDKKYSNLKTVELLNTDILKFELNKKYEYVVSNLPYNISSQILVKLSSTNNIPDILILMFQKEFAKRLLDKNLNSINSLVRCFYNIRLNFHVSKNCFRPIPKIESSVLTFAKRKEKLIKSNETLDFINFKRKLFSYKRKSLKKILKGYDLKDKFDLNLRVENLKLDELVSLFRTVNS